jgi:hypothetical protein
VSGGSLGAAVGVSVEGSEVGGEVGGQVGAFDRAKVVGAFDGASRLGAKEAKPKLAGAVGATASATSPNRGADEKALGEKIGLEDTDHVYRVALQNERTDYQVFVTRYSLLLFW